MKISVYLDAEIDEDGVQRVWVMDCPLDDCGVARVSALYWENVMEIANHHAAWHNQKADLG